MVHIAELPAEEIKEVMIGERVFSDSSGEEIRDDSSGSEAKGTEWGPFNCGW